MKFKWAIKQSVMLSKNKKATKNAGDDKIVKGTQKERNVTKEALIMN